MASEDYDESGDEGGRYGQYHTDEASLDVEPVVVVILHHVLCPLDHKMLVVAEPQAVQHNRVEPVHDTPEGVGREGTAPERSAAVYILHEEAKQHTEDEQGYDLFHIEGRSAGTVAVIYQAQGLAALDDGRGIVEDGLHRVPGHQEHEQREERAGGEGFEQEGHRLLVLVEVILSLQFSLGLLILMGEVSLPAGAEVDMPAPESSKGRLRAPVIVGAELAFLTGVLCHRIMVFQDTVWSFRAFRRTLSQNVYWSRYILQH